MRAHSLLRVVWPLLAAAAVAGLPAGAAGQEGPATADPASRDAGTPSDAPSPTDAGSDASSRPDGSSPLPDPSEFESDADAAGPPTTDANDGSGGVPNRLAIVSSRDCADREDARILRKALSARLPNTKVAVHRGSTEWRVRIDWLVDGTEGCELVLRGTDRDGPGDSRIPIASPPEQTALRNAASRVAWLLNARRSRPRERREAPPQGAEEDSGARDSSDSTSEERTEAAADGSPSGGPEQTGDADQKTAGDETSADGEADEGEALAELAEPTDETDASESTESDDEESTAESEDTAESPESDEQSDSDRSDRETSEDARTEDASDRDDQQTSESPDEEQTEASTSDESTESEPVFEQGDYVAARMSLFPPLGIPAGRTDRPVPGYAFNLVGWNYGLRGIEIGALANIERAYAEGFQVAGLANWVAGPVKGFQVAGTANVDGGLFRGFAVSSAFNFAEGVRGVQIAAGPGNLSVGDTTGLQMSAGINWTTGEMTGVQTGAANIASDVNGMQFGLLNIGNAVDGFQLGAVNIAADSDASVGLVNVNWDRPFLVHVWTNELLVLSAGLQHGSRHFHNLFRLGYRPGLDVPLLVPGAGLGSRFPVYLFGNVGTYLEADAMYNLVVPVGASGVEFGHWLQMRVTGGIQFGRRIAIYGGLSFNAYATADRPGANRAPIPQTPLSFQPTNAPLFWPGIFAGLRL